MDTLHIEDRDYRKLIKMANMANAMLLGLHIYLLLMFAFNHIWLMVGVNLVSLLIYGSNFFWAGKNLKVYFVSAYLEILIHMVIAVFAVGWDCGFQIYVFALVMIIYFGDYIFRKQKWMDEQLHPRLISVIVIILYPFLYLQSHLISPLYPIGREEVRYVFFILNALFVLIFFVIFVDYFLRIILQTEKRLGKAAWKDELTHMNNRRRMQERMHHLMSPGTEKNVAVAILDIDDFKRVNDTYGHNAGDMVLEKVAEHILKKENESMVSCRWGGEEFLILSEGSHSYDHLVAAIGEILSAVEQDTFHYEDSVIRLTMSAGISKLRKNERIEHAISRADQCLYQAKSNGKNRFVEERQVAFPKG